MKSRANWYKSGKLDERQRSWILKYSLEERENLLLKGAEILGKERDSEWSRRKKSE